MKPPALPTISKNALKTLTSLFTNNSKITHLSTKQVSPHIKLVGGMIVDLPNRKADLAPDIVYLVKNGMSVSAVAEKLGISVSYTYKLLKKGLLMMK